MSRSTSQPAAGGEALALRWGGSNLMYAGLLVGSMKGSGGESPETVSIETGDTVYDDDGHVLGIVNEFTDEGFGVEVIEAGPEVEMGGETADPADSEDEEDIPGKEFGEGYLMWRCEDCGEMGDLEDGIPEECPDCGAPKEHIHMAQED